MTQMGILTRSRAYAERPVSIQLADLRRSGREREDAPIAVVRSVVATIP
jgi:hypothetical protein